MLNDFKDIFIVMIILAVVFIVTVVVYIITKNKKVFDYIIFYLIEIAENLFKDGEQKLKFVTTIVYYIFNKLKIKKTYAETEKLVQENFDLIKDLITKNDKIKNILNKKDNDTITKEIKKFDNNIV